MLTCFFVSTFFASAFFTSPGGGVLGVIVTLLFGKSSEVSKSCFDEIVTFQFSPSRTELWTFSSSSWASLSGSTICGSSLEASGFEAVAVLLVAGVVAVFDGRTLTGFCLLMLLLLLAGVGFVFGTPLTAA